MIHGTVTVEHARTHTHTQIWYSDEWYH